MIKDQRVSWTPYRTPSEPRGSSRSEPERDGFQALRAARFEVNGWAVAVVGIDQVLDPLDQVAGPNKPGTAGGHDFRLALRAVRDAAASWDLVFVMIHWGVGTEGTTRARCYGVRQAHRMIEAGADLIFGAHPHVLQPMEPYRGARLLQPRQPHVASGLRKRHRPRRSRKLPSHPMARISTRGWFRSRSCPTAIPWSRRKIHHRPGGPDDIAIGERQEEVADGDRDLDGHLERARGAGA